MAFQPGMDAEDKLDGGIDDAEEGDVKDVKKMQKSGGKKSFADFIKRVKGSKKDAKGDKKSVRNSTRSSRR